MNCGIMSESDQSIQQSVVALQEAVVRVIQARIAQEAVAVGCEPKSVLV